MLNKRWTTKMSDTKLNDKLELIQRPENCSGLIVPRVNPEIWSNLHKLVKRRDLRTSNIQKNLAKAGSSLICTTNKLLQSRQSGTQVDPTEVIKSNMEIILHFWVTPLLICFIIAEKLSNQILIKSLLFFVQKRCQPLPTYLVMICKCNNIKTTNKLRQSTLVNKGRDNFDRRRSMQPSRSFSESLRRPFLSKKKPWQNNKPTSTKTIGLRAEQNGPNSTVMESSHKQYVANLITDLHQKVNCFEAGRISQCIDEWRKITFDPEILDVVSGYTIELIEGPSPHINQSNYELTSFDDKIVGLEISKLIA